ncbi:DedA family protein [Mycetocola reblochoni]|uniref:DedA protein n=3 Tax=Mycetocola reblochoni TaxID=331618 RepID=A0A1R4JAF4_9MICO|nr:VTT domain-containing protein [Mycetocola reblochoni]RLP70084.1 DedA family protein [Mycetocola reblochoni]SJN28693.1 DedA protein [Mycetocola reblochoni REB411]
MHPHALIPWLDTETILAAAGPYALLVVCLVIFSETGLLVGFLLPGDTLLIATGLLAHTPGIGVDIVWVCAAIALAAFLGGEVGYLIGKVLGPRVFDRRETGLFSKENVDKAQGFFDRFGGLSVILARFVPILRTFVPVAAGTARMRYSTYSLFNLIGASLWGAGVTLAGYLLGYIPPLARFVSSYIDLILIVVVLATIIPVGWHYYSARRKAKTAPAAATPRG